MSKTKIFLLLVCVLACGFPLAAAAQNCPSPVSLGCPEIVSGTTLAGPSNHLNYGCTLGWDLEGPEAYYTFTLTEETNVQILLEPTDDWDPAFVVLPESGGDCDTTAIVCVDDGFSLDPEAVSITLQAGTYYIVVESYDAAEAGSYDLTFTSPACEVCEDMDDDNYNGYDPTQCLSGTDCCDTGAESSPGCTSGNAAKINPGAEEVCGDGIDNDCDGQDDPCPDCEADDTLACDDTGTVDTSTDGTSNWDDYCDGFGAWYSVDWSGPEYIFSYTAASDGGVVFSIDTTAAMDIFALSDYGDPTVCNPDGCVSLGGSGAGFFTENTPVAFYAEAGETYFISVDGYEGASGSFDYDLDCRTELCVSDADIFCKDSVSGDTTGKANNVSVYKGWGLEYPAPEYVYTLQTDLDAEVTVDLVMQNNIDLGLMVIEDGGDGCDPGDVIASSDIDNAYYGDWTEYVSFSTTAGTSYFIVVDGWQATEVGTFDLEVSCSVECGEGFDDCGLGYCTDVSSDVDNCGACDHVCDLPNVDGHDCVAGACTVVSCDAGYDDCDTNAQTGCEVHLLSDRLNCGTCGIACGADEICEAGSCQGCAAGEEVCGNSCVDTDTDPANCGGCGQACDLTNVDQHGCVAGVCTVVSCDAGFGDCDADASNGCEVDLLTSVSNCGDCGQACDLTNVDEHGCVAGACTVVSCDANFGDCDADAQNGCEVDLLTSVSNCGDCGQACDTGAGEDCCGGSCIDLDEDESNCGACGDACATGENCCGGDCTDLTTDVDNCGACGRACATGEECTGGTCQAVCGAGETNCNGSCVDLNTDVSNCGACGHGCMTGESCINGACCADADSDGHYAESCGGDDCDDNAAATHPGAEEICNDIDDDCNGTIDDGDVCKRDKGCGCAATDGTPASGLYLILLALGLACLRRSG
jgi:hypothetical protein